MYLSVVTERGAGPLAEYGSVSRRGKWLPFTFHLPDRTLIHQDVYSVGNMGSYTRNKSDEAWRWN
jgi:hypothetical protein